MNFIYVLALTSVVSASPQLISDIYNYPIKSVFAKPAPRIFDGQQATPNSFPYHAHISVLSNVNPAWMCNGVLVSRNYVLTQAACLHEAIHAKIILGAFNVEEEEVTQVVLNSTNFIIHEFYDHSKIGNDIALIQLPQPVVETPVIRSIALPSDENNDFSHTLATISSWMKTNPDGQTIDYLLHFSQVFIITNEECGTLIDSKLICAEPLPHKQNGLCEGDVGVPLVTYGRLVGLAAFVFPEQCPSSAPSGFTRISSYISWILANSDVQI